MPSSGRNTFNSNKTDSTSSSPADAAWRLKGYWKNDRRGMAATVDNREEGTVLQALGGVQSDGNYQQQYQSY